MSVSNRSSVCPLSATVPTVCLNKWRWECMRVTWSPLRLGRSRNVPKSAPKCSRTSFSHSPSLVSYALFSSLEVKKERNWGRALLMMTLTTSLCRHLTEASSAACRQNQGGCHLCSVYQTDNWVFWPSPALCHLLISKAPLCTLDNQSACVDSRRKQWSQKGRRSPQG